MKLRSMVLTLAGLAILTGCDNPALLSLEPLATSEETAIDAGLVGTWVDPDDKDTRCLIRRDEPNGGYQVTYLDGNTTIVYRAQLFHAGEADLLDLTPQGDDDFRVPGHAIVRIWHDAVSLRWAFLDSDWLKDQAAGLASRQVGGKLLLLAPSAAVRAFLDKRGASDQAYGKAVSWQRLM